MKSVTETCTTNAEEAVLGIYADVDVKKSMIIGLVLIRFCEYCGFVVCYVKVTKKVDSRLGLNKSMLSVET